MTSLAIHQDNIGTIYCIGRNYALHAKELNNPIPKSPVIFTKVKATVCACEGEIALPADLGRVDHETEVVVRIGTDLFQADNKQALAAVSHYGMGLDLTLREKQTQLKEKRQPWELAKSFVNACPLTAMLPVTEDTDLADLGFSLTINGEPRQQGNTSDMLFDIATQISYLSQKLPLQAGDIIMTGTPEGVGPLYNNDKLELTLQGQVLAEATVVRA